MYKKSDLFSSVFFLLVDLFILLKYFGLELSSYILPKNRLCSFLNRNKPKRTGLFDRWIISGETELRRVGEGIMFRRRLCTGDCGLKMV